jgi:hypothetical protein
MPGSTQEAQGFICRVNKEVGIFKKAQDAQINTQTCENHDFRFSLLVYSLSYKEIYGCGGEDKGEIWPAP